MSQTLINVGTSANDGSGDSIRLAGIKINSNFTELYNRPSVLSDIRIFGNDITTQSSNADIVLKPSGTGAIQLGPAIKFEGNNIIGLRSNEDIFITPSGTGKTIFAGVGFSGTTISAPDSSSINFNENVDVDGTITAQGASTLTGAVTAGSTLDVTGVTTVGDLVVAGSSSFAGTVTVDNLTFNDNIIGSTSNADIRLEPGGTGSVVISNLTLDNNINITDNEIKATASNSDLILSAAGTGQIVIGAIRFNGTSLSSDDSSTININEGLVVDGTATIKNGVTLDSTLDVTSTVTVTGNLIVSGSTTATGTVAIDNLTFNDNIIGSASNANIRLEPGGTGSVNISNLQIDSNLNFTDNEITLSTSNEDIELQASGTGSISISKIALSEGTIDNTTIGATTPAAGSFSTLTFDPNSGGTLSSTGVTITDNTVTASLSTDNIEFNPSGSGKVVINEFNLPTSDGGTGQLLKTDGSGNLSFASASVTFGVSNLTDTTQDISYGTETVIDHVTSRIEHELIPSSTTTIDSFETSKYDSAFYYAISRDDVSDEFEASRHSIVHNNSSSFISSYALVKTGTNNHVTFTTDVSGGKVRFRGTGSSPTNSFAAYRIGLGDNDSSGYTGEQEASVITTDIGLNTTTEVDSVITTGENTLISSSTTTLDSFATSAFDSAFYLQILRDDVSDEFEITKSSVVHNNSNAFISTYSQAKTGTNNHVDLTTDISSGNVRLRGTGSSPTNSSSWYRIGLGDNNSDQYSGEEEAAVRIDGTVGHQLTTTIDHVTATGVHNYIPSSATTSIDEFSTTKYDSALYYAINRNDVTNEFEVVKHSVVHNNSDAFVSSSALVKTDTDTHTTVTADVSDNKVRLRGTGNSADKNAYSFYRIGLGDDDSTGYSGEDEAAVVINTDVDSASEVIDSFAKGSFRGAKYFISVNNASKTEVSNLEAVVVHNGSDAFISVYNVVNSGSNDLVTLTAAINGANVEVKAAGLETNLRVHAYRILLADNEADRSTTNIKVIGDVTVSSSATAIDTFNTSTDDGATEVNGAHYVIVAFNSSEGEGSICEAAVVSDGSGAFITQYAQASTKSSGQITLTAAHDGSSTVTVSAASTSGASTKVNAYRINLTRGVSGTTETQDSFSASSFRGAKYYISINDETADVLQNKEILVVHDGSDAFMTDFANVRTGSTDMLSFSTDISGGNVRLIATVPDHSTNRMRVSMYRILLADNESDRSGTRVKVIGDVTVSSAATVVDTFDNVGADGATSIQGAHYILVANNSSEGAASICEAAVVAEGTNAFITQYAQTSTKDSGQITLTADHDGSSTVSLKAASTSGSSTKVNAYRVNLSRPEGGNTFTLDTFAHATFRGAKYYISINDSTDTELNNMEALVVHNGTDAFVSTFGNVETGSNTYVTLDADISGSNVRLRATIGDNLTNPLRVNMYRVALVENEANRSGTNVSVTGNVTVTSSATQVDTFDNFGADGSTSIQAAHYIVVAHNSSEGAASIREAAVVAEGTNAFLIEYGMVSTKSSQQITLTATHDGSSTVSLNAASTSGSNTKVSVYRMNLPRGEGSSTASATLDSNPVSSVRSIKYIIQAHDTISDNYELIEANVTHDGSDAFISTFGRVSDVTDSLLTYTADISGGNVRLRGELNNVNDHTVKLVKRTVNV